MTTKQSYNPTALVGDDYDDADFAQHLLDTFGIQVPREVLYTPELNIFVQDKLRDVTKVLLLKARNPVTGRYYTQEEANEEADCRYENGRKQIKFLEGNLL